MSFVPAPQQANTANANNSSANASNYAVTSSSAVTPSPEGDANAGDNDFVFKNRTFDVLWVDRAALMYKDGINKVS